MVTPDPSSPDTSCLLPSTGWATLRGGLGTYSHPLPQRLPHCLQPSHYISNTCGCRLGGCLGSWGRPTPEHPHLSSLQDSVRLFRSAQTLGRIGQEAASSPVRAFPAPEPGSAGKEGLPEREGVRALPAHGVARPPASQNPEGAGGPPPWARSLPRAGSWLAARTRGAQAGNPGSENGQRLIISAASA